VPHKDCATVLQYPMYRKIGRYLRQAALTTRMNRDKTKTPIRAAGVAQQICRAAEDKGKKQKAAYANAPTARIEHRIIKEDLLIYCNGSLLILAFGQRDYLRTNNRQPIRLLTDRLNISLFSF